jgi:hypothetical protein
VRCIPNAIEHVRRYVTDMAYVMPQALGENDRQYKIRLYHTQVWILRKEEDVRHSRMERTFPDTNWELVWKNLHEIPATESTKATWYVAINDLVATNSRLEAIHVSDTAECARCSQRDTLQHRITDCGEEPVIWNRLSQMLGHILRMDG